MPQPRLECQQDQRSPLRRSGAPAYLERLLQQRGKGMGMPRVKHMTEINPGHPVIAHLKSVHERQSAAAQVAEWIEVLHTHDAVPAPEATAAQPSSITQPTS